MSEGGIIWRKLLKKRFMQKGLILASIQQENEFISLTDIAKYRNEDD